MEAKVRAPRETASARRDRAAAERRERESSEWASFSATYSVRFVNALYNAMTDTDSFDVTRNGDNFEFIIKRYSHYTNVTLPLTLSAEFTWEVIDALDTIERRFAEIDAEIAESLRQSQRRTAALAKLDAEERKLLGL